VQISSSMTKKRSQKQEGHLTLDQKAQIVQYHATHVGTEVHHDSIAKWATKEFKLQKPLHRTSIGRILCRKHEFINLTPVERNGIKNRRSITHSTLETALKNWVIDQEHKKICLSIELIKTKAKQFAKELNCGTQLKFSNGWYESFARRNGFKGYKSHGESGDAQMTGIEDQLIALKSKIASYSLDDVYNMDETAYLYNMAPDKTIARRQIEGAKKDKTRLTIALTCNATSTDRVELLILGHAERPRCFQRKSGQELGFFYCSNSNAWMTGDFFQQYLHRLNAHVRRKVLLIIDNAPSHKWRQEDFPNLDIVTLPPNTTSKLQPLDAGIIASFKCQIRKRQLAYALDALDNNNPKPYKIDQLTAMRWARQAWQAVTATTIQNCWRHTGLLSNLDDGDGIQSENMDSNMVDTDLLEDYQRFIARAHIREAMAIEKFLNPIEEDNILREIENMDMESFIIQSAQTVDIDEAQEAAEAEVASLYSDACKEDELAALTMAITVYEKWENPQYQTEVIVGALRGVQRRIRREIESEKESKRRQLSIRQFLE
jgi:DDE superfamily endonuclease/Tc5 transposase DNA-binding domain